MSRSCRIRSSRTVFNCDTNEPRRKRHMPLSRWFQTFRSQDPRHLSRQRKPRSHARSRLGVEALEQRCMPSVYTVSSTANSGAGSLRQAILNANSNPGTDTIQFSIGTGQQLITPTSALPTITDPVVLDATTQPGYAGVPLIELTGGSAGSNVTGL